MTPEEAYWMGYRDGGRRERDRNRSRRALSQRASGSGWVLALPGIVFLILSLISFARGGR